MESTVPWKIYNCVTRFNNKQNKDIIDLYKFIRKIYKLIGFEFDFVQSILDILGNAIDLENAIYSKLEQSRAKNRRLTSENKIMGFDISKLNDEIETLKQTISNIKQPRLSGPHVKGRIVLRKKQI